MKQADLRDMFNKALKSACTSADVVSPNSLFPAPSASSAVKIPEDTREDPDDPELLDEGHIQNKLGK
jgi:hypothetical protein